MRQYALLLAASSFAAAGLVIPGLATAQAPGPGEGQAPAQPGAPLPGAATPGAPMPGAQMPQAAQPSTAPTQADQEPARAPGATSDQGKAMPKSGDNSGTTTTYAPATPAAEVKWPCAQPRVGSISPATIWAGPDVAQGTDWDQDNDLAALAQKLASRRTTLDEVDPLVAEFAKNAGAAKDKQLTKLFVGVLDIINENRGKILQGIMRYAQGQERLAERMRDEADKISEANDTLTGNNGLAAEQKNREFAWDQRIFKERRQALTYVCETPSLLERRAYQIGKIIQAKL